MLQPQLLMLLLLLSPSDIGSSVRMRVKLLRDGTLLALLLPVVVAAADAAAVAVVVPEAVNALETLVFFIYLHYNSTHAQTTQTGSILMH